MEITWYGHSCFRITERGLGSVVCDPYDHLTAGFEPLKLKADIVTCSFALPGHSYVSGVKGNPFVINGPGEYEINNVFINGYRIGEASEKKNTIYVIEFNGIFVAHLGNLNHIPSLSEIEAMGTVHVLLIPVGGDGALNAAKAVELISLIKPNIAIPMHYADPLSKLELDPLGKFLKEMGISQTEDVYSSYKLTNLNQLPEETKIIILNHPLGSSSFESDNSDESDDSASEPGGSDAG